MTHSSDTIASSPSGRVMVFHPVLLAIFPILSLLAHNRHEVHLAWALAPLLVAALMTLGVWALFALLLRDWVKGAVPASLAMLMFFSFGHFVPPLSDPESPTRFTHLLQVLLGQLVLLLIVFGLVHRFPRPTLITRFANVAALVAVVAPVTSLVRHEIEVRRQVGGPVVRDISTGPRRQKPDIYLIIPDAHARGDVLRDVYSYDPEPFFAELESMGFAIPRQSSANYSMTPVSLASILNFRYHDPEPEMAWGDLNGFNAQIRSSALEDLLRDNGYKTVAFPSGASYTEMRHFDQYYHGIGAALGFYRMVADLTPLSALLEDDPRWNALLSDRDQLLRTFEELPRIARDPDPTFTFVHLSLPHPPFQFGENGEDVFAEYRALDDDGIGSRSPEAQKRYPEAYRRQTIYTDRRLTEIVREILATSEVPPVILIMSDHGPRLNFNWRDAEATDVREALGNLVAVYLPGNRAAKLMYPTITPVNVMRIALNEALGTNLPLLEDRAFLSTNVDEVHQLADVTGRLMQLGQRAGSVAEKPQRRPVGDPEQPGHTAPSDQWAAPFDSKPLLR